MTNSLNEIIEKLEQQGRAIERALSALREVEGPGADGAISSAAAVADAPATRGRRKGTRKGGMTPEGRKRLSEALRARWAARKAGPAASAAVAVPAKAKRQGGMTPEGRKRLSEALKKRWAAKRAGGASPAKKAGRKRSAA